MKLRSSLSIFACTALLSCSAFAASVAQNAVRQSIGGIDLVVVKTGIKDVVTIRGTLAAGDARSPESNVAMADLAAGMLDKGTATRDKFAIAKALGDVGATIGFGTSASALNITAKCLRADLPMVMNLLAEQLRAPAFSADEFGKLKSKSLDKSHVPWKKLTTVPTSHLFARFIPRGIRIVKPRPKNI